MALGTLFGFLEPLLDKVVSFIPDPEQKRKAKAELMKLAMDQEQAFRDFVVAYEGRGDQVHWTVQIYRSSVRPTITYAAFVALVWAIWGNQPVEILELLFKINLLTLAFWFGPKALERLGIDGEMVKKVAKRRPE